VTICAVLILALFLVRPEVGGMRTRITNAISSALGRPVDISSVSLRFLPQPGFDLENFVVHDDPAFSAEPVLRSQEVTAVVRISSLLRGRLEIARLSLTEPSLNLVRTNEGHWNLGTLVERAAKSPVAPTGKTKSEPRPGFPYIEASNGRINFKLGQEKKAYILTDADFSVWQDSENGWSMRLKARPIRTDSNLSDTGTVRAEGSWQRAALLGETPLNFNFQWEHAQLGQFSKWLTGTDKGWRGGILLSATVAGTPSDLRIGSGASIEDFRRYDIVEGDALRLAAQCSGRYNSIEFQVTDLICLSPVGDGSLQLTGRVGGLDKSREYDLSLNAKNVPMSALIAVARHAKKNIPDDLVSTGRLQADLQLVSNQGSAQAAWQGSGTIQSGRWISKSTNADLILDHVPFKVSHGDKTRRDITSVSETRLEYGPFRLSLGAPVPVSVRGWVSRSGYSLQLQGDARVRRLLQLARTVGLPSAQPAADGLAKVDLHTSGEWSGFQAPVVVGTARLSSLRAEINGLSVPLEIATANVTLRPTDTTVQNVTASLGESVWHGSLDIPRFCVGQGACRIHFDLQTKELTAEQLGKLFASDARSQPWYRFLSSAKLSGQFLANLNAEGKLSANRVALREVTSYQVSANLEWKSRKLKLSNLRGSVLGGLHAGEWNADFSTNPPHYDGTGSIQHLALEQLAEAMHDSWVTGTASGSYEISGSGTSQEQFLSSLQGALQIETRNTTLPHILLTSDSDPLAAHHFAGKIVFRGGGLELREGKLETTGGIYQVSGTAQRGVGINMQMVRDGVHGYSITGSLAAPRVAPTRVQETQAALKSQ
jgi:AsmA-like protein